MAKLNEPLFFCKNRVRRLYTGGARFASFFGDDSTEGRYPEEWMCSTVRSFNADGPEDEGLSRLESGEYFVDLVKSHKKELLGDRAELGILVKILNSSIRLMLQVHPDREFSKKYLGSNYGKTESWVILDADEDACVYFGFTEHYTLEQIREAFDSGDEQRLLSMVNRYPAKPGDVFLIPARAVHAIGAGCLLLEVQEPTDFTIKPEPASLDHVLTDAEKYIGLTAEQAFSCFDTDLVGREFSLSKTKCVPKIRGDREVLISYDDTPCFGINRLRARRAGVSLTGPAVYAAAEGEGTLVWDGGERKIKRGGYFFSPACMDGKIKAFGEGLVLIECLPPKI